jgi:hypothetical protein
MNATTACVQTTLTADANANTTTLSVSDLTGFTVDGRGFISDGINGELFTVRALSGSTGAGTVTTSQPVSRRYATVSGVYALQERKYSIDPATYGIPTLVRSVDGQTAVPIAAGIETLQINYRLNTNCPVPPNLTPPCDTTAVPASNAVWNQVSEVIVTLQAKSPRPLSTGQWFRPQSTTVSVQPRNILVYQQGS